MVYLLLDCTRGEQSIDSDRTSLTDPPHTFPSLSSGGNRDEITDQVMYSKRTEQANQLHVRMCTHVEKKPFRNSLRQTIIISNFTEENMTRMKCCQYHIHTVEKSSFHYEQHT